MIINLTPHEVIIRNKNMERVSFPPAENPARCSERTWWAGDFDGFECVLKEYRNVENLPEPKEGVLYIVSKMVRDACPDRPDLANPADLVRDDDGNIEFASSLCVNRSL